MSYIGKVFRNAKYKMKNRVIFTCLKIFQLYALHTYDSKALNQKYYNISVMAIIIIIIIRKCTL